MAIGGGSIADLFEERDRAGAMALYVLGPLFGAYIITFAGDIPLIPLHQPGPVLGPIAGGFVAQNLGVKWVFIIIASSSYFFQLSAQSIHHLILVTSRMWCRIRCRHPLFTRDICAYNSSKNGCKVWRR